MANTFNEFAECDESYGDKAPEPTLDAEGYPQVLNYIALTNRICNTRVCSRSNPLSSLLRTSGSFAIFAQTSAAASSSEFGWSCCLAFSHLFGEFQCRHPHLLSRHACFAGLRK